jgi:tRNA (guanine-N7-)-methyltransferase
MPRGNPYADVPAAAPDLDLAALAAGRGLELEIGFGRGGFLMSRAAARPDALVVGLELRRKWVAMVRDRSRRAGLTNVEALYGDARYLLPSWTPDGAIDTVFVNFPDPWWKKRHLKRLLLVPETIEQVVRLLVPGGAGKLFVQTDVEERALAYQAALDAVPELAPAGDDGGPVLHDNPWDARSHREARCIDVGLPVFRLQYVRR